MNYTSSQLRDLVAWIRLQSAHERFEVWIRLAAHR
jgi:hypothetical protein